ncbi:sulfurtransferase TusA family protein [Marinicrinis sediminis]|uniref:Sulfurtransferase TusA family protein n=1 Tax=Marinicrinis sediminis TaxID=1652465 RepID=A0ABW5RGT0_9BACL
MSVIQANHVLDAKGLACPMPIVKTKKTMKDLQEGQVLEIQATDKGSKADLKAWAESTGHQYLGTLEEGELLKHYLRKAGQDDQNVERQHPHVVSNEELAASLTDEAILLDVREAAEYAFARIPGAISIPLGELEERMNELQADQTIYVICRTGSRSDMAAQKLAASGFSHVYNVVPGMSQWTGETTGV